MNVGVMLFKLDTKQRISFSIQIIFYKINVVHFLVAIMKYLKSIVIISSIIRSSKD